MVQSIEYVFKMVFRINTHYVSVLYKHMYELTQESSLPSCMYTKNPGTLLPKGLKTDLERAM